MEKRKATLSEVAELAGVSLASVSKVLNGGRNNIGVSAKTRKCILDAAEQLNYRQNMAASILAGGSSKLIGVFVDSLASYRTLRVLQELERLSSEHGYRIITSLSHDNISNMRDDYYMFQQYGVNSFICCSHDYPNQNNEVVELFSGEKNVVFMEKPCVSGVPYVRTSNLKALTEMVANAHRQGYRRIGILHSHRSFLSGRAMHEEFLQAMTANGLEYDEKLIFEFPLGTFDPKKRIRLAIETMVLPCRPDFLFIDDAIHALTLRHQLLPHKYDIKIYGGNGDQQFDLMDISSFDPCYDVIAEKLLEMLHKGSKAEMPVVEAVY